MPPRRTYIVREFSVESRRGPGVNARIDVRDGITPFLKAAGDRAKSFALRAARHVAFLLQRDLKSDLKSGKAGSQVIPPLEKIRNPVIAGAVRDAGRDIARKHGIGVKGPYLGPRHFGNAGKKLVQAVGYQQRNDGAVMGWLSGSASIFGGAVQDGRRGGHGALTGGSSTQLVTPKMRRYFFAIGFHGPQARAGDKRGTGRTSKKITQKRRPVITPFFDSKRSFIPDAFTRRFLEHYSGLERKATKARRSFVA